MRSDALASTRGDTLGASISMRDQTALSSGTHEEGTALALCPGTSTVSDSAALADPLEAADEAWQSLHVAAAKLAAENSFDVQQGDGPSGEDSGSAALETTADAFSSEVKKDAELFPGGFLLGACGDFLGGKLLEVLSLRSQAMGKGDRKAVFPLPTSRSELQKVKPTMNARELSWLICVVRSLKLYVGWMS